MNYRYVANQCGLLLVILGLFMLGLSAIFFGIEGLLEHDVSPGARLALFVSSVIGLLIGGVAWRTTRKGSLQLGRREALLLVAVSWVGGAALAALPYFLWAHWSEEARALETPHEFRNYISCYFEAMSGLTTTGATVLGDIESVPRSLLLWRAITHWLGGLGIVVLFVAVLPSLGVGAKKLFRVEAPGPSPEGLSPQIRDTARVLWYIYLALTAAQVLALLAGGMNLFDAVCHTCATLATGGFSTRNASVGAYDGLFVRLVIIVFMVLAGLNFGLYYQVIRGRARSALKDTEMRLYLIMLVGGSALVFVGMLGEPISLTSGATLEPTVGQALEETVFTTISVQTTTGFCTSDFNKWPFLSQAVLVMLMFVGGCGGSTAGGIKVIRIWIAIKVMLAEIEHVFRPHVIRPMKLGGGTIDPDMKLGTVAYVLGIILLFTIGSGLIMLIEDAYPDSPCNFTTAATASVATLCTIGPGLAHVGPVENYGWFSVWSKLVMCVLMVLGRLEVFAIIVLFSPRFWSRD
ncbi:MAG: TrkH family potassium uptake protein [Planctomycetota bacterium]